MIITVTAACVAELSITCVNSTTPTLINLAYLGCVREEIDRICDIFGSKGKQNITMTDNVCQKS